VLRLLCDRRDEISRARAQARSRLHRLFLELVPGGAPVKKSASQHEALLATVRPRDLAARTRRRMAAEKPSFSRAHQAAVAFIGTGKPGCLR
jgi:transposase